MMIALVVSACLPIAATARHHRAQACPAITGEPPASLVEASAKRLAGDALARLPMRFEASDGRAGHFLARLGEYTVSLTATEAVMAGRVAGVGRLGRGADLGLPRNAGSLDANEQLPEPRRDRAAPRTHHAAANPASTAGLRMRLIGANPQAGMAGEDSLTAQVNYLIGSDPKQWRTNVPTYARIKATQVYRGIDVVYYGNARQFEYDFNLAPGADFRAIRLRFAGARRIALDPTGDLIIETAAGQLRHGKPIAYQLVNGVRREIASRFVVSRSREVGFAVGAYDHSLPLVIDPVLNFASLLADSEATGIALDAAGNIYLTGSTNSQCFPITPGVIQPGYAGTCVDCEDVFITKLDPTASTLIYSTYLGGAARDEATGIVVDSSGNAYVTGLTQSRNFPVTPGAFQAAPQSPSFGSPCDAFVAKLNPIGTALIYSTYLGGRNEDHADAIAVGAAGDVYVAGLTVSNDFPTLNPLQGKFVGGNCEAGDVVFLCSDAFITRLNGGGGLVYSTFIGGNGTDQITGLAVDGDGNLYATGTTGSTDFPTTAGAFQAAYRGDRDFSEAFVFKLNAAGSALAYSTYLGGSGADVARAIALDAAGDAYVTGYTTSTDFPVTPQALQPRNASSSFFKSANGGGAWSASGTGLPSDLFIQSLAVAPTTPATLYLGTSSGLYRSTDGGASWDARRLLNGPIVQVEVDPKNPATVYTISSNFFFLSLQKSTDGGATWRSLRHPAIFFLVIDPQNPAILYASTNLVPNVSSGVIKSTDGGASWQVTSEGLQDTGFAVRALAIDPSHPATLYASAPRVFRTVNGGLKWKPVAGLASFNAMAISPADSTVLYAATDAGVFKSGNGGTKWKQLDGLPSIDFSSVRIDPATPATVYATARAGVIFKSTDSGASWAAINSGFPDGSGFLLAIDPRNPATLYGQIRGGADAFVTRLNVDGTGLAFSTYLGGGSDDSARALALNLAGDIFVAGLSSSLDFPIKEALQSAPHNPVIGGLDSNPTVVIPREDMVVTKLSGDGSALLYSTYLGRALPYGIAVDAAGNAYVAGETAKGTKVVGNLLPQRFMACNPIFLHDGFVLKITDLMTSVPAPVVAAISPTRAPSAGGSEVTITGSHFLPGAAVRIGGVLASNVRVLSSTTIKAVVAPNAGHLKDDDVAVINPDGQSNALVNAFSYVLPPVITGAVISGKDLIVTGNDFDGGAIILLNGEMQSTTRRALNSGQIELTGKKLGKRIKPGLPVTLQVQNADGQISLTFPFMRPPQ